MLRDSIQFESIESLPLTQKALIQGLTDRVSSAMSFGLWLAAEPQKAWVWSGGAHLFPELEPAMNWKNLPVSLESVFDLASVSKVMGTASLMARGVDRGWWSWFDPVQKYLPGYPHREVQMHHLLSHTAGYTAWSPFYETMRSRAEAQFGLPIWDVPVSVRQAWMREQVIGVPLEKRPGESAVYSDLSFLILGFALEEAMGLDLDRAVNHFVLTPLGAEGAGYRRTELAPTRARDPSFVATENCPWRGTVLQGQVHDDNCFAMGGYGGHAGLFGRVEDVLRFAAAYFDSSFLSHSVVREAWTPVVKRFGKPQGCSRTWGWDTPSGAEPSVGRTWADRSSLLVGHLGFTGTSLWIDAERGIAVTLLTNRVHPSRNNEKIRAFRAQVHEALSKDLSR